MRIRDRLGRIKRIAVYGHIASFLLVAAAAFAWFVTAHDACLYLGFFAMACLVGSVALGKHGARCPRCRHNLGSLTQYFGEKPVLLLRPVRFCLFCGVSLDEPHRP
jgi:hypothetical protein